MSRLMLTSEREIRPSSSPNSRRASLSRSGSRFGMPHFTHLTNRISPVLTGMVLLLSLGDGLLAVLSWFARPVVPLECVTGPKSCDKAILVFLDLFSKALKGIDGCTNTLVQIATVSKVLDPLG